MTTSDDQTIVCKLSGGAVYAAVKNYLKEDGALRKAVDVAVAKAQPNIDLAVQSMVKASIATMVDRALSSWRWQDEVRRIIHQECLKVVHEVVRDKLFFKP